MQDENPSFHASFPVSLPSESETKISLVPVQQQLTQAAIEQIKFLIGLRLLGEERAQRYLSYLQSLRDTTQPEGEGRNATTSI